jgi:hypothetical protein
MAVAAMAMAGCLAFTSKEGGTVEIVDNARFERRDAVERICAVLADPEAQREIGTRLEARGGMGSSERFMEEMREAVLGLG